eukprot:1157201-Pelagomonas_calceolata.AAC.3
MQCGWALCQSCASSIQCGAAEPCGKSYAVSTNLEQRAKRAHMSAMNAVHALPNTAVESQVAVSMNTRDAARAPASCARGAHPWTKQTAQLFGAVCLSEGNHKLPPLCTAAWVELI